MDWGHDERGLNRLERCEGCGEEFPYASGDLTECQLNENYDACGLEYCEECHEKTHVRECDDCGFKCCKHPNGDGMTGFKRKGCGAHGCSHGGKPRFVCGDCGGEYPHHTSALAWPCGHKRCGKPRSNNEDDFFPPGRVLAYKRCLQCPAEAKAKEAAEKKAAAGAAKVTEEEALCAADAPMVRELLHQYGKVGSATLRALLTGFLDNLPVDVDPARSGSPRRR